MFLRRYVRAGEATKRAQPWFEPMEPNQSGETQKESVMSKKAAEHHRKASEHSSHAARHHEEAAKQHEAGTSRKGGPSCSHGWGARASV